MSYKILIADDEVEIIDFLRLYLEKEGYEVIEAHDGKQAFDILTSECIDLAIIDIMMPYMSGYEVIKQIRKTIKVPLLLLSARSESMDKVLGLGLGADDYITKPCDPLEVVARVQSNLRRCYELETTVNPTLTVGDLQLDLNECLLIKDGQVIELTSIEFKILKLLMTSPGRVFTKQQIYEAGWGEEFIIDDNNIMVYISKIREKIGNIEGESYIKTIRGLGYKIVRPNA